MPPAYPVQVIEIRAGSATDATAIARVRRESWHAAYKGIIAAPIIERATALGGGAADPPPYRRTLVAEAGEHPAVVGFASYGPERAVAPPAAHPLTADGVTGQVGELYALYVTPQWWSAGVGRALMGSVLAALASDAYRRVVLWVLADNARARRFYERAGFAPDGGTNVITGLGGVLEVRYARALSGEHLLDRLPGDA